MVGRRDTWGQRELSGELLQIIVDHCSDIPGLGASFNDIQNCIRGRSYGECEIFVLKWIIHIMKDIYWYSSPNRVI